MNRSLKPLPRVPAAGLFRKSPVFVLQKEIWICLLSPANYVLGAFFLITFFLFLKICFWLCWVFIAVFGLSLVAVIRGHYPVTERGLLIMVASLVVEHGLYVHGF